MLAISLAISAVLFVPPLWILLPRAGIPSTVALVGVVPFGAILLLWIMAMRKWPNDDLTGRF